MERAKQERIEKAERAVSFLIRLGISIILPVWALAMLAIGIEYRSAWWIGTGVVVGAIGVLFLAGSPLTDSFLRQR